MPRNNLTDDLINYLKKNLKKGYTRESLIWALVDQGYSKNVIDRALRRIDEELASTAPILRTKPEIKYEIISPREIEPEQPKGWRRFLGL